MSCNWIRAFRRRALLLGAPLVMLLASPAFAANIVFDSNTGTFTVDGNPATQINGVTVVDGGVSGGVRTFQVQGDLNLLSTDVVSSTGSNGVSLFAGNNVSIAAGAQINIAAGTTGGGAGGAP